MASSDELIAAAVNPKNNSVVKTGNIVLDRINEEVERQRVVPVIPPFNLPIIEDQDEVTVPEEKETVAEKKKENQEEANEDKKEADKNED